MRIPNRLAALGAVAHVGVVLTLSVALVRLACSMGGTVNWLLTAGVIALAGATLVARSRGWLRIRIALTVGLLGVTATLTGARATGRVLLASDVWPSRGYAAVLALACVVAAVGLLRRAPWSRWLVLALGSAGTLGGAVGLAGWARFFFGTEASAWTARDLLAFFIKVDGPVLWTGALITLGSLLFVLLVSGAPMRDAFGKPFTASDPETLWRSSNPLVASIRVMLIAETAGAAMSLLYAWGQPVVAATVPTAVVLAVVFLVGALLTLARKTAGALLLVVVGIGFLAQSAATMHGVTTELRSVANYYSLFWSAAGLASLVCGAFMIRSAMSRGVR